MKSVSLERRNNVEKAILTQKRKSRSKEDKFEILKNYSTIINTRNFQKISIPKLPVFTTEDGIRTLKQFIGKISDWKNLNDFVPENFKSQKKMIKTGNAGIFAASLELAKEGNISIKQDNLFDEIFIKER